MRLKPHLTWPAAVYEHGFDQYGTFNASWAEFYAHGEWWLLSPGVKAPVSPPSRFGTLTQNLSASVHLCTAQTCLHSGYLCKMYFVCVGSHHDDHLTQCMHDSLTSKGKCHTPPPPAPPPLRQHTRQSGPVTAQKAWSVLHLPQVPHTNGTPGRCQVAQTAVRLQACV